MTGLGTATYMLCALFTDGTVNCAPAYDEAMCRSNIEWAESRSSMTTAACLKTGSTPQEIWTALLKVSKDGNEG